MSSAPPPAGSAPPRLVLLPNTDEPDPLQDCSTDDDDNDDGDTPQHAPSQPPVPPLSSFVVFLYLLSPYLRLGAIHAADIGCTSLVHGLTSLLVAASLSALCRQIWFLLGRYLRRSSTEDILAHIVTRRPRRVSKYTWAHSTCTIFSALFRVLLAAMYLRDSVDSALLLKLPDLIPSRSRLNVSILLSVVVFVLSLPKSLASTSVIYTTGLSVTSYLALLIAVSRSYGASALLLPNPSPGVLWNAISSLAFACTTTMTVPLSAALMTGPTSASRNAKARHFQLLNMFSTMLAVLFVFPLVIVAASPRAPATAPTLDNLILGLRIATLLLSVPSVIVSITLLPFHGVAYHFVRTDLALSIIIAIVLVLGLVPPTVAGTLDDLTLFLAVFGAFLLPALAHVIVHYFRRPLSIVVPQAASSVPNSPCSPTSDRSPSPSRDPLLQRKERLLQRRRFGKRLLWDIVIWVVLIPICTCALVWATGRLARRW